MPLACTSQGWLDDTNGSSIVLGDCSQTIGEAIGGSYQLKCMVYGAINLIIFCVTLEFEITLRNRRLQKKAKTINVMERLTLINLFNSFVHMVCCIDLNGFNNVFSYTVISVLKGTIAATMLVVAAELITSWVYVRRERTLHTRKAHVERALGAACAT